MKCPECGGDMIAVETASAAFNRLLLLRLLVCEDEDCRFVVIVDWRWEQERSL